MSRPSVPPQLKRRLYQESGYRCSIPACRGTSSLQMAHITPYREVKTHKFENMIVLCANCHIRYDNKEMETDVIRNYKLNLAVTNGRYSIFEMRLLEFFYSFYKEILVNDESWKDAPKSVSLKISQGDQLHVKGLVDDGFLKLTSMLDETDQAEAEILQGHGPMAVLLTQNGMNFIIKLYEGDSLLSGSE